MIRFNNDYNHGALDSILSALTATNTDSFAGYGEDIWCQRAETVIKQLVSSGDALIKFVHGATQANLVVIAAALSPIQSVIAADTDTVIRDLDLPPELSSDLYMGLGPKQPEALVAEVTSLIEIELAVDREAERRGRAPAHL